eukprot:CAMPEP_0201685672 /NCGR_PEP_ID=MMETSP0578-20130828/366_1 /ASSEMBLY_ACC=CAM_ASM_000663 /TAXON_ID=267565 /ORGANISM="Skeletonema grethea, Strain CCMP 1804" /LENGTH=395 /DNA_ID=CAMNT_0048169611 /DNA_START=170 /DNA_END=1357 /DNA_ORIENTATION=+
MAALTRATKANYIIHDHIQAETTDREDHTFCGIMFPVKCKDILPLDHLVINSVAIRGALGPLTVWVTKSEDLNGEIQLTKKHWTKIYQKEHKPSFVGYEELDLSAKPIILKPGQVKGIYIHSTRRGDEAIVYDNKAKQKTVDDSFITILPGRAHVSEKVFGSIPIWGWGSAWRDNREFVGQLKYGAVYKLWNPQENLSFGGSFRTAARILFMCQRRKESPFSKLPDDCLFFILNMMRWDWVNDTSVEMRREQKQRRRLRRQQMIQEADAIMDEENNNAVANEVVVAEDDDAQVEGEEEEDLDLDLMDEDSSDDSEDADTSDSDDEDSDDDDEESSEEEEEYAWGDHVGSRSAFHFNADDSSDSENSEIDHERDEDARRFALMRARRNIISFLRSH